MHWTQGLSLLLLQFLFIANGQQSKRQVGIQSSLVNTEEDRDTAETGFGAAGIGGHGKYFQDIYSVQLAPHKIEFGHVCESPHDWEQRYERKDLAAHKHQGKVRWGDKHGGYGEHYWDYNHAGDDHDGEGGESQAVEEYEAYEPSESNQQLKVNSKAEALRDYLPGKRHERRSPKGGFQKLKLAYDPVNGLLIDEVSGKQFYLKPVN